MITKKKKVLFFLFLLVFRPIDAMDSPKILLSEVYTNGQRVS